jgi:hypothetical protein
LNPNSTSTTGAVYLGKVSISGPASGKIRRQEGGSTATQFLDRTPAIEVNLNGATGEWCLTSPLIPAPADHFAALAGKKVQIPLYVAGDSGFVDFEIGGEVFRFPVDVEEGDSGGVANVNLTIPEGWDGTAKVNGVPVQLAPRMLSPNVPTMDFLGVLHSDPALNVPPGFSSGQIPLPAGMTIGNNLPLPAGMTVGTGPPVLVPSPTEQGVMIPRIPVSVTTSTGGKTWRLPPSTSGILVGSAEPLPSIDGGPVVSSGTGTTGNDADDMAIVDAAISGDVGEKVEAGAGMAGLADQWQSLKNQVDNKFGDFSVMSQGSIPKATSLQFSLNFERFGVKQINLDLTQAPFTTARTIALVFVTLHAGWFFIKFLKI